MLPFGSVDGLHNHAEVISSIPECGHQPFAVPSGLGFEFGKRLAISLGDIEHRRGFEPDQALVPLPGRRLVVLTVLPSW